MNLIKKNKGFNLYPKEVLSSIEIGDKLVSLNMTTKYSLNEISAYNKKNNPTINIENKLFRKLSKLEEINFLKINIDGEIILNIVCINNMPKNTIELIKWIDDIYCYNLKEMNDFQILIFQALHLNDKNKLQLFIEKSKKYFYIDNFN